MSRSSLITINDKVKIEADHIQSRKGTVKFVGEINGQTGIFYGVELIPSISSLNNNMTPSGAFAFLKKSKLSIIQKSDSIRATVGDIVNIPKCGCNGIIRYIGETEFKPDIIWYGVQLEEAKGKNNGLVNDVKYFVCDDKYGVFVKEDQIQCIQRKKHRKHKKKHNKHKQQLRNKEKVNIFGQNMSARDTEFIDEKKKKRKHEKYLNQLKKLQKTGTLTAESDNDTVRMSGDISQTANISEKE